MSDKPPIVEAISQRVPLRKAGKEYVGRCPFHEDKTPSFFVNEEKGVFLCRGCQERGDVFDFIMKLDGVSFTEAAEILGVKPERRERPRKDDPLLVAARVICQWSDEQFLKAQALLRDTSERMYVARELRWTEEVLRLHREWLILSDLSDDLQNPSHAIALWESRAAVENLLKDAEIETPEDFPPLTEEYRERLRRYARGSDA